jgi:putative ATP-dependent endonuclease of OLD family
LFGSLARSHSGTVEKIMKIESVTLKNLRCFGLQQQTIHLTDETTSLVGTNGAGKTAVMHALLRLFGISDDQRRVQPRDFHVPCDEKLPPSQRKLEIEAVLAFSELEVDDGSEDPNRTVPYFFKHMSASIDGKLKCRIRLEGTWIDDGSAEGSIESKLWGVRTLVGDPKDTDKSSINPLDRAAIQVVYIPATRDGAAQVSHLLRGRLWRAIKWTDEVKDRIVALGREINEKFSSEESVAAITDVLADRWSEIQGAGTHSTPSLRPIEPQFEELVRKIGVSFFPDETGRTSNIDHLSDGQRSMFHLALTTAMLDIESAISEGHHGDAFERDEIAIPALTVVALEEPENCLAPFYLSRILHQMEELARKPSAQVVVSSHSASILARIDPEAVRYFSLDKMRCARVRSLTLPSDTDTANKYVREAVRAYPEIYFARFVIFGEGDSEEIVLPRIGEALGLPIDRSFVAIVPLGGRHVNHFWRLVHDLGIPHATLLDFDLGRYGGGWGRIQYVVNQLIEVGTPLVSVFGTTDEAARQSLVAMPNWEYGDRTILHDWLTYLKQSYGVYFSQELDLDWAMLNHFPLYYQALEGGERGPKGSVEDAKLATLGDEGNPAFYSDFKHQEHFKWYRYLFLGRGKPVSHLRALSRIPNSELAGNAPRAIVELLEHVAKQVQDRDGVA